MWRCPERRRRERSRATLRVGWPSHVRLAVIWSASWGEGEGDEAFGGCAGILEAGCCQLIAELADDGVHRLRALQAGLMDGGLDCGPGCVRVLGNEHLPLPLFFGSLFRRHRARWLGVYSLPNAS